MKKAFEKAGLVSVACFGFVLLIIMLSVESSCSRWEVDPAPTRVFGFILDASSSNAISGIHVKLLDSSTNQLSERFSDTNGSFEFLMIKLTNEQLILVLEDVDTDGTNYEALTNEFILVAYSATNITNYLTHDN